MGPEGIEDETPLSEEINGMISWDLPGHRPAANKPKRKRKPKCPSVPTASSKPSSVSEPSIPASTTTQTPGTSDQYEQERVIFIVRRLVRAAKMQMLSGVYLAVEEIELLLERWPEM